MAANRRTFLKVTLLGGALLTLPARAQEAKTVHPNMILIMADDHTRAATGCYGSKTMKTPNIDRIAEHGVKFNRMFVTNSLCAPSRAVLLTGKYNHCNGYLRNGQKFDRNTQTFPKLLQQSGYETALIGKWHLQTEPAGFDYYLVMPGHGRYTDCPLKEKGQPWQDGGKGGRPHKGYLTDVLTDQAINWMKNRDADKPFCLMLHHKAPHETHEPAPRHRNLFSDEVIPEPPTLLDDYRGRAPEHIQKDLSFSRMAICHYRYYEEATEKYSDDREKATRYMYQIYMKGYLRLVAALDESVGRVLDYLKASGLDENTMVVYTSDNGFFNGEHGFFNKMWMYEESMRTPMLVQYPGVVEPGTEDDHMVSMLDLAPTFLDLAGATIPQDMQGRSILPLLKGEDPDWRDAVYYHYYAQFNTPEQYGIRTDRYKLIRYPNLDNGPEWELFDLKTDPRELNNLASTPDAKPVFDLLRTKLEVVRRRVKEI